MIKEFRAYKHTVIIVHCISVEGCGVFTFNSIRTI